MALHDLLTMSPVFVTILLVVVVNFLYKLYNARITIAQYRRQGLVGHCR